MSVRFLSGVNIDSNTLFVDDANNRVGIGTASPAYKLDVAGDVNIPFGTSNGYRINGNRILSQGSGVFEFGALDYKSTYPNISTNSDGTFRIQSNGSTLVTVNQSGNVGIGTTSPVSKLTVIGTTTSAITVQSGSATSGLQIFNNSTTDEANIINYYNGPLILGTSNVERMRIAGNGNVGIGTTSPASLLNLSATTLPVLTLTRQDNGTTAAGAINFSATSNVRWQISTSQAIGNGLEFNTADGSGNVMYITRTGNVGIGTTSPSYKLDVNGETRLGKLITTWSNSPITPSAVMYSETGYNTVIAGNGQFSTSYLALMTTGNMIYSGGNVGIGTTSPGYSLDVAGTSRSDLHIFRSNQSAPTADAFIFRPADNTVALGTANSERIRVGSSEVWFKIGSSTTGYEAAFTNDDNGFNIYASRYGGTGKYLTLNSTGAVENMRLTSNGNVGIGTTSPNARLTVVANDSSNPNVALRLSSTGYSGVSYPYTSIRFGSAYSSYPSWNLASIDAGYTGASWGGSLLFYTNNDSGETNLTERMRITAAGNVGIGTTSPSTKLHTVGNIRSANAGNTVYSELQNDGVYAVGTDLYLLAPASKFVSIYAGNAERMRIASTGATRLNAYGSGSFTGTVAYNLAVDSSGNIIETAGGVVDGSGTANYITKWIDGNTVGNSLIYDDGTTITFQTGASERMRITSAGNVGIGTTAPSDKLTILGSSATTFEGGGIYNSYTYGNSDKAESRFNLGKLEGSTYQPMGSIGAFPTSNTSSGDGILSFYTRTSQSVTEKMRITSAGNVGIGTTAPTSPLHISSATNKTITLDYTAGSGSYSWASFRQSGTEQFRIWGSYSDGYLSFYNDQVPAHQLTLASSGNVGIGTTSPSVPLQIRDNSVSSGGSAIHAYGFDGAANLYTTRGESPYNAALYLYNNPAAGQGYGTGIIFRAKSDTTDSQIQGSIYTTWTTATDASRTSKMAFSTVDSGTSSDKVTILGNGNVGIGTTAPGFKLTVVGGNGNQLGLDNAGERFTQLSFLESGSQNSAIWLDGTDNMFDIYANTGHGIRLKTGGDNPRLTVTSGGNVGIGTTSPATKLDVNGGINIANGNNLTWGGDYAAGIPTIAGYNAGAGGALYFYPNGSTSGTKMFIASDGNVGIGTTAPGSKLDVYLPEGSYVRATNASSGVGAGNHWGFGLYEGTALSAAFRIVRDGTADQVSIGTANNQPFAFWQNNTERMRIAVGGNVGIGTTAPSQLLHVSGNIRVTGAYYDSNNSAGSSGQVLSSTGSGTDWVSLSEITGVDGTGTANYIAKWSDTDTITNSSITDNGTTVTATATNFVSQSNLGTAYTSFTTSGTTAIFDTITRTNSAIYQIVIVANPNSAGSGSYADFYYGKVFIGTGYNGSAVVDVINYHQESPMPRGLYGSGGGDLTVTAVMLVGGSEVTEVAVNTSYTIRIKIAGYNVAGSNTTVRLQRIM